MKPLLIHPAAVSELEDAVAYHKAQTEGLGRNLRIEVERAFGRLRATPQACPPHRRTGYRKCFVARFPYTIFFLELPESIWVAAVAHGRHRPAYWQARAPADTDNTLTPPPTA
jgi:toxin ParE1/3/4